MTTNLKQLCTGPESISGWSRREFLNRFGMGLGGLALADLLNGSGTTNANADGTTPLAESFDTGELGAPHFAPKAKRVIYLFQSGGPSQMDLYDYKPLLNEKHGTQLPREVRAGQRLTGMSGNQTSLPLAGSPFKFTQHGQSGTWMSETLPNIAKVADDICVVKSMYTEAINHGPAVTFLQTGSQFPGRPSIGAWLSYGLGTDNANLPSFVVLITKDKGGQPLLSRFWGNGFLPAKFQGVRFRSGADPLLYLSNPDGVSTKSRRMMLDRLKELHLAQLENTPDAEIENRINQYEMAFRMQSSAPEATDFSSEPEHIYDLYGKDSRNPGSFAANCILARRLAERGVKFIQLYHPGWDQHGGLQGGISQQCRETDQASAALIQDLKQRGMLEDTLIVWGGEFGRTNYCQGKLTADNFGRDHHPRCFSIWMAGGGVKGGTSYGETDPYGYNILPDKGVMHVHDLHATMMSLLGIDHERLTFKFQGRRFRLTDVHGRVVENVIA